MSDEVLVYATLARAAEARKILGAACAATSISARLELYGSGSLFQRLGPRHAPPLPDLVLWNGPFAAHAAALAGLLQGYRPARVADAAVHDAQWRWTTLALSSFSVDGSPAVGSFAELGSVPRLALADPERSEAGLMLLLASLDSARQREGDAERGWAWWQQRAQIGMRLFEDEASARAALGPGGGPSHTIGLSDSGPSLPGLAAMPNAVGLAANARNVEAARALLDWLCGPAAAAFVAVSPWNAAPSAAGAPALDVDWATGQYNAARRRWSQSGFGPTLTP